MNEELNLKQIIEVLLPKWVFILVGTLIVALLAFVYSAKIMDPVYVAQGRLYITGTVESLPASEKHDTDLSDLMISQELSRTYGQLLSSKSFFKDVAAASDTGCTYEKIQKMTKISNVENTGILQVSVSSTDPVEASAIANTILECAPEEIERVIVRGSASIIELADVPVKPSSPNISRNTIIGALVGLVLSILIVFLQNMFDKSIKSAEEVKDVFGLPVLGTVPVIDPHGNENKSSYDKTDVVQEDKKKDKTEEKKKDKKKK